MSEEEHSGREHAGREHRNDGAGEPASGSTGQQWNQASGSGPWSPADGQPGPPPPGPQQPVPPPPGIPQPGIPQPGIPQPGTNPWAQQGNPWGQQSAAQGSAWGQPNPYSGGTVPPPGYAPPPKPGVIPLRPLGLGEIMDGAFQACRRNALAAFGNAFVVQAVITLLVVVLGVGLIASFEGWLQSGASSGEVTGPLVGMAVGSVSTLGGLSLAGVLIVQGLLVLPVARSALNLNTRFGQVWQLARGSLGPLAGLALLMLAGAAAGVTVLVLLGYLILDAFQAMGLIVVIPAFFAVIAAAAWVSVKLSLAPAALVLEGIGVFPAVRRSWQLTKGNWWRTFGILALTSLTVNVLSQILSVPLTFGISALTVVDNVAVTVLSVVLLFAVSLLVAALTCAFQSAVTALLYIDLRIRREGFDLALMKDQENPQIMDPGFLPGRKAVPLVHGPYGPPAGTQ